ncbi:hypothetical protein GEMRC1_008844 [Eukaryota sp. GEM-RC1]
MDFFIDKFVQTGGTLMISSNSSSLSLINHFQFLNGSVISNSPWSVSELHWTGGMFSGTHGFTSTTESFILGESEDKICDAFLFFTNALFSEGIIVGTSSCSITTSNFLSKSESSVFLKGCDAKFSVENILTVERGTLVFEMGRFLFQDCESTISSQVYINSNAVVEINGPVFFNEDSLTTGDIGGKFRVLNDTIVSGTFNFQGCVYVLTGARLMFESARVEKLIICQNLGNISLSNSIVYSVLISEVSGGIITIDQSTSVDVLEIDQYHDGHLVIDNAFIQSLVIQDSNFSILNNDLVTFVSTISVLNATLEFPLNNTIVTKSITISDESTISSGVVLIDISRLTSIISISPSTHCCNTSMCHVSFYLKNVDQMESNGVTIESNNDLDFVYDRDYLNLTFSNVYSLDSTFPHVVVNISLQQLDFLDQLVVTICSIDLISFVPSTIGGITSLFAFNLGFSPLIISSDSLGFNQSLEYLPLNHREVVLDLDPGHGCHVIILSRSTDLLEFFFHVCFKKPVLFNVSPLQFHLSGNLVLTGSDLSTSFDFFSLSSVFNSTIILCQSHDEIVVYIPHVCSVDSVVVDVFLVVGNQTTNYLQIFPHVPNLIFSPRMLPSSGSDLRLTGVYLGSALACFDGAHITVSGTQANFTILNEDEIEITTGPLFNKFQFSAVIHLPPVLLQVLSVHVTSFKVINTSSICFINFPCEIFVSSEEVDIDLTTYQLSSSLPFIQIVDHSSSFSTYRISYMSSLAGNFDHPQLCNSNGCSAIRNLPFIAEAVSVSPRFIQWFGHPVVSTVTLEIMGIHTYSTSSLEHSFTFQNVSSDLVAIGQDYITFSVFFKTVGNYSAFGLISSGLIDLHLNCTLGNFVIIPPFVGPFSTIEMILLQDVSNLLLVHGAQSFVLEKGINQFELFQEFPVITLKHKEEVMNVTFIKIFAANQIPLHFQIKHVHSFVVDFFDPNYRILISSTGHCDILEQSSLLGVLNVELFGDLEASFQSLSPLNSQFHLNSSLISTFSEDFNYDPFSSFPYQYSIVFNLSSFSFSFGEGLLALTWQHDGYNDQEVVVIRVFNVRLSSVNSLSVYEARDLRVDFLGLLESEFVCSIQGQTFDAYIVNGRFFCKNSILITYEPFVLVSVFHNHLYVNSLVVLGEAFIQEICYLPLSDMPLIDSTFISSNIDKTLIFDGSRCCTLEASFCGEFLSPTSNVHFNFDKHVDILKIVITTNGSCYLDLLTLNLEIITQNETIPVSSHCQQIPSGFEFVRMCAIDIDLLEVSYLEFSFFQTLYLLEVEFYGYSTGSCLKPVDIGTGITSSGQSIAEQVLFEFDDRQYSTFEEFYSSISDSITMTSLSYLRYNGFLISSNCYYSYVPFTLSFTPSNATQIDLISNIVEFDRKSDRISIPVICLDAIGFVVDCVGDFSIVSSTFSFSDAELTPSYLTFCPSQVFILMITLLSFCSVTIISFSI